MTEKEYIKRLELIINDLKNGTENDYEEEINMLYNYKPVRFLWYVAKAWWWHAKGRKVRGLNVVSSAYYSGIDIPYEEEYFEYNRILNVFFVLDEEMHRLNYLYGNEELKNSEIKNLNDYIKCFYEEQSYNSLVNVMNSYLAINENVVSFIIRVLLDNSKVINSDKTKWYYNEVNYGYLEEKLLHSNVDFIIIENDDLQKVNIVSRVLHELGHHVYVLSKPALIENVDINSKEMINICMDNREEYEECTVIPVCEKYVSDDKKDNNRAEIIKYLYENNTDNFGILLADGNDFYELLENNIISKNIECLSNFDSITASDKMYFGWVGDYTQYISDIYDFNVAKKINEEPCYDFSIVVPARNSAGTLYHTLKTCLNQDYKGSYEIIVSDNSTGDKQEVYQVCKDLNDERIKYIKTPRDLQLTKSFEFAFLQAKGDFILSVGSDDGVCPWALTVLKEFLDKYPEEDILQWKRGYYAWKDFDDAEANKLVIPGKYNRDNINSFYKESIDYFAEILKYTSYSYSLPNMYINSGFKHKYLKKLLEKTGRLWDGCNQDLYMGIISAAINDKVLNIDYPLTVAGMSKNSLGYISGKASNDNNLCNEEKEIRNSAFKGDNAGVYVLNGIVKDIPIGRGEVFSLYANLLRGIQLGVLPSSWKEEVFDYKKIYSEFFEEHTILDDEFEKYIHYARYLAKKRGQEFLDWFDNNIYKDALKPRYYIPKKEDNSEKEYYKTGVTESGGLILNAAKYDVTNIYEAVQLFEKFINWTSEDFKEIL